MTAYTTESYNLDTKEAGELLGYHPQYIRILTRKGQLPALKRYRQWFFCERELKENLGKFANITKRAHCLKEEERHANDKGSARTSSLFL